jgi:GAF domain-containing protein
MAQMNTSSARLAIAELTAALTTDFDLPTVLDAVVTSARAGFDAYSAVLVLRTQERPRNADDIHAVALALREPTSTDLSFQSTGPAAESARTGAVAMIADLAIADHDARWAHYRGHAAAAGIRGMRAFPVVSLGVPLGSLVLHTEDPWGVQRPNDLGQILADLTALALSIGPAEHRSADTTATIKHVVQGTAVIASATGILAETFSVDVAAARQRLIRLARAHGVTVTTHARAVVNAHDASPRTTATAGALHPPADLAPPPHIDS